MKMVTIWIGVLAAIAAPLAASAEEADYNQIELSGLARDVSWGLNSPGIANTMVCNVNGPDGFLTVRAGPGSNHAAARRLKRLAHVVVDTSQRRGRWVRVTDAYRSFSPQGVRQGHKPLPVTGWAHDGYLCSFTDYPASEQSNPSQDAQDHAFMEPDDLLVLAQASGKPARCEWDNGSGETQRYGCRFMPFDGNGSFSVVRADGYELMLTVESPGRGQLVEFLDGRRGLEFGNVMRSNSDPACWETESGAERLCAR